MNFFPKHTQPELLESRIAPAVIMNVADASVAENGGFARFIVSLSEAATAPVQFQWVTLSGTAVGGIAAPADFLATEATGAFMPGEISKEIAIPVFNDATVEANETFVLRLRNISGAAAGDIEALGTIMNDDAAIPAGVSVGVLAAVAAGELEGNAGTKEMLFNVRLSAASTAPVTVRYATESATTINAAATAGQDYEATAGELTFAPGEVEKTVTVRIIGDTVVEPNEQFSLRLTNPVGAALATNSVAPGKILNDDVNAPAPSVSVLAAAAAGIAEGNSGTKEMLFTLRLSSPATSPVSVRYATESASGTVNSATVGLDYEAATGEVLFAVGEIEKSVPVRIIGDTAVEPNETFIVRLSNPVGAMLSTTNSVAPGNILNDDAPPPPVSLGVVAAVAAGVPEGNDGTREMLFTIRLSAVATAPVTVQYATEAAQPTAGAVISNGATAGEDYEAASGGMTFAAGELEKTVAVRIFGDTKVEPNELFALRLSNPVGAVLSTTNSVAPGIILNDDAPVPVLVGVVAAFAGGVPEGNDGTREMLFTIRLSAAATAPVTVHFTTEDVVAIGGNVATAGEDYETTAGDLTFASGETEKTVSVRIFGDTKVEPNELFALRLSNPVGAALSNANSSAPGNILNDDAPPLPQPTVAVQGGSVAEGNDGTRNLVFRIVLSAAADAPVTVNFATGGGSNAAGAVLAMATPGEDYEAVDGSVTFAPGELVKEVPVIVKGDTNVEPNEVLDLRLLAATGAALGTAARASGTIVNDDFAPPPIPVGVAGGQVLEGNDGTRVLNFRVLLSRPSTEPVTVNYSTSDTTASGANRAVAGEDYESVSGELTFAPGETEKVVPVLIKGDTNVEPDEVFSLAISNSAGALPGTAAVAFGIIVNDDTVAPPPPPPSGVIINPNRRVATWTDVDGDLVMLVISKPVLDAEDFALTAEGVGLKLDALLLADDPEARGASISVSVRPNAAATGNGSVSLGCIDAAGLDLGSVTIRGDLGSITAGDDVLATHGIVQLNVRSLIDGADITGRAGNINLRGDLSAAVNISGGVNSISVLGKVTGDIVLDGALRVAMFGSIEGGSIVAGGNVDQVRVNGSATDALIASGGNIGAVRIAGIAEDLSVSAILGIRHFSSAGISGSNILAGYSADGSHVRADASIGEVIVRGDWSATNLVAGAQAGLDGSFGTSDDAYPTGTTMAGRIGGVFISGAVAASDSTQHGIVASAIRAMRIGTTAVPLTAGIDMIQVAAGTTVREVAVV